MEDIVWIGHNGYDNGGAATLGIEFNKNLGIKTYYKSDELKDKEIITYKDIEELRSLLNMNKPKIILFYLAPSQNYIKEYNDFFELIFDCPAKEKTKIIAIDCSRKGEFVIKPEKEIEEKFKTYFKWKFDSMWSLSGESKYFWEDYTKEYLLVDINLYTLRNKELGERDSSIGYISRYHAIKGIVRLIRSFESSNYKESKYPYVYLGNLHNPEILKNKGIVSGVIYVVNQFAKSIKDKTPKECYSIKSSINEDLINNKINIYPRYNYHEKEEAFKKVGVAICPTLAREKRKEIKNHTSLFLDINTEKDKDDKYLEKNKKYWPLAMEYVNYEFIDYGIPVMFSRDYCLTYDSTMIEAFPELIYDNLEDCFTYCQNNYENLLKIAPKQKEWLKNKLLDINNKIKLKLNEILNEKEL